jgi:hypothetical protein
MHVSTPTEALRELAAIVGDRHVISDALDPFRHLCVQIRGFPG